MGNRAVIAFDIRPISNSPAIYLHWNGGMPSVAAFLQAARQLGYAKLPSAHARRDAVARLIQKWFVTGSVYVGLYGNLDADNGDNGVYAVDMDLEIVDRLHRPRAEESNPEKMNQIFDEVFAMGQVLGPALAAVELHS